MWIQDHWAYILAGKKVHTTALYKIKVTTIGNLQDDWDVHKGDIMYMQEAPYVRGPILP